MRKAAIHICISLALILMMHIMCYGGSITYGTTIDVYGGLKVKDNALCFPDNTCMTTALINDGSAIWGQITGLISNQTDLQNQLNLKEDKLNKGVANGYASLNSSGRLPLSQSPASAYVKLEKSTSGYTPEWQLNFPSWVEDLTWLTYPETSLPAFIKLEESSKVDVYWTDNVGTYGASWCNVGIFFDDSVNPSCYGSWLGTYGYMNFGQQTIHCNISLTAGIHSFKIKHRSQHCAYGNYPSTGDSFGSQRQLIIREVP